MQVEYTLTDAHMQVLEDKSQYRVLNAGRRFGKTQLAIILIAEGITSVYTDAHGNKLPPFIIYTAPTVTQAYSILWDRVVDTLQPLIKQTNKQENTITFINKAVLKLGGSCNWDSLRGKYCTRAIMDEFAFVNDEDGWERSILPMLATPRPQGDMVFMSTPDGKNKFYELHQRGQKKVEGYASWSFPSTAGGFITKENVESFRFSFTHTHWRQEFFGEFIAPTGLVYYAFDSDKHVKPFVRTDGADIHWAWDFNVNPACHSTLSELSHGKTWVFDEIAEGNTPQNIDVFCRTYPPSTVGNIYLYGDYNGTYNTSGNTDFAVMIDTLVKRGYRKPIMKVYGRNPIVRDRTENVNRLLLNAEGQTALYVSDRCKLLIRDFEKVRRNKASGLDKTSDVELTHISDALGYQCWVTDPPVFKVQAQKRHGVFSELRGAA